MFASSAKVPVCGRLVNFKNVNTVIVLQSHDDIVERPSIMYRHRFVVYIQ